MALPCQAQFQHPAAAEWHGTLRCFLPPSGTTTVTLPGTHLTPCGGDITWPAGRSFSAVDVFAASARAIAQADNRRLAARVVAWLDSRR